MKKILITILLLVTINLNISQAQTLSSYSNLQNYYQAYQIYNPVYNPIDYSKNDSIVYIPVMIQQSDSTVRYSWLSNAVKDFADNVLGFDPSRSSGSNSSSSGTNGYGTVGTNFTSLQWNQIRSLIEDYCSRSSNVYIDCNGRDVWYANDKEEIRSYNDGNYHCIKFIKLNKCPASNLRIGWKMGSKNFSHAGGTGIFVYIAKNLDRAKSYVDLSDRITVDQSLILTGEHTCSSNLFADSCDRGGTQRECIIKNIHDGDEIQLWAMTDSGATRAAFKNFRILGKLSVQKDLEMDQITNPMLIQPW